MTCLVAAKPSQQRRLLLQRLRRPLPNPLAGRQRHRVRLISDYDGRLVSIERKPAAAPTSHGERTLYTLDAFGHRIQEERQSWDGNAWVTAASTTFEYSTRCHLDRVIEGMGLAEQSVTEYAYDCDGNLERVWDANHPSNGQTEPASTVYAYECGKKPLYIKGVVLRAT